MSLIGLELTFVPDLPGRDKEYTSEAQAVKAAKRLNKLLFEVNCDLLPTYATALIAKAERFRRTEAGDVAAALGTNNGEWRAWIVEITNGAHPTDSDDWYNEGFIRHIQRAFDAAKSMGLLPRIRRRGVHWPTGGGHIQQGIAGLFPDSFHFTSRLAAFESNLFVDYANRPYIRWLFSEWWDDTNSEVTIRADQIEQVARTDEPYAEYVYELGVRYQGGIRRRFSDNGKHPYSTYEHRYFDMAPTAKQLALQIRFLLAWINHVRGKVYAGETIQFTLTKRAFNRLRDEYHAWRVISDFLVEIGITDVNAYRPFFDDQYVNRMRHGKMV